MLTRKETLLILAEGLQAYKEVLDGGVYYEGVKVEGQLGSWGGVARGQCTVCVAGARFLKKSRKPIMEMIADLEATGLTRIQAMKQVIGDPERILDSLRYPALTGKAGATLSGGMTVFGLFRILGIHVPPCNRKEGYLTDMEVIERIQAILLINPIDVESGIESLSVRS